MKQHPGAIFYDSREQNTILVFVLQRVTFKFCVLIKLSEKEMLTSKDFRVTKKVSSRGNFTFTSRGNLLFLRYFICEKIGLGVGLFITIFEKSANPSPNIAD